MALSMSSGGAGAGGGMSMATMAHQVAPARAAAPPPPQGASTSARILAPQMLGTGEVDKRLRSSAKNSTHFPIVAVDLYGGGNVSYYPAVGDGGPRVNVDKVGSDLVLKCNDDVSYKSVRNLLIKGYGYAGVLGSNPITNGSKEENGGNEVTVIHRPHSVLGARRVEGMDTAVASNYSHSESSSSSVIDEHGVSSVTLHDQALDGSAPNGDDFDRVSFNIPLHSKKKPLTLLPEEAVGLILAKVKHDIYTALNDPSEENKTAKKSKNKNDAAISPTSVVEEDQYLPMPTTIPVPGYAASDATLESLIEACGDNCSEGMLFNRGTCALAGALRSLPNQQQQGGMIPSKLLRLTGTESQALMKNAQKHQLSGEGEHVEPLIMLIGMSAEGLEVYAVQLSRFSNSPDVPIGHYKFLHAICARSNDPLGDMEGAILEMRKTLSKTLPNREPCAICLYGSTSDQTKVEKLISKCWNAADNNNGDAVQAEVVGVKEGSNTKEKSAGVPPICVTREDVVANGACLRAAILHGRLDHVPSPISVQPVCTAAIALRINYFADEEEEDGDDDDEDDIKIIFDFDRRVPAGPYTLDLSAAECAYARANNGASPTDPEDTKKFEGSKNIPKREEAAKALQIQVVQKCQRTGKWINVGEVFEPLCMMKTEKNKDGKEEEKKVACESAALEISVSGTGLVSTSVSGDGESVVQALKSARASTIQWYATLLFCVLFFGGFFIKSYIDERILVRDTKKLLEFYKYSLPGSMHDGDEHGARYLAYKYRGRKEKLWRRLENKYGMPVLEVGEYPEPEEKEEIDLDDETEAGGEKNKSEGSTSDFDDSDDSDNDDDKGEQDL
mmetsp:Transcript_9223/g.13439  ORF Transcript_9223/g.13439 Transcript_9223/m.13439 type:complete len:843 (+) Transcript_9223:67-2595(+)|eukprot:CAMPEP_0195516058 /NCGR_PEP_ID=MMETSP0794_2-20130614/6908_1 /TAXON_ID=515487 /ORGANISM="Stephanopyxis turris, Strain CCMP 815" /LENGTH=842 /DNA_ID=CAMNT_0040644571 /DNA_START=303 /DNA_END=2831 /DNA_ORIENTATION=+